MKRSDITISKARGVFVGVWEVWFVSRPERHVGSIVLFDDAPCYRLHDRELQRVVGEFELFAAAAAAANAHWPLLPKTSTAAAKPAPQRRTYLSPTQPVRLTA